MNEITNSYNQTKKFEKININQLIFIILIIICVIPSELILWTFENSNINRPYGNNITVSLVMIISFGWMFLSVKGLKISRESLNNSLVTFFLFGIVSIFFPINRSFDLYLIGAIKYLFYIGLFILLTNKLNFKSYKTAMDIGFKISLLIQTLLGTLYVFGGVLVPFISNYSTSIRNGLSRMTGSFAHPGDFSLYISIIFVYFICESIIGKKKAAVPYMLLAFADLYLSGARSMLMTSIIVMFVILMKKYKRKWYMKILVAFLSVVGSIVLVNSEIYQNLFVSNSIYAMFMARFVHWIIGFKIIFEGLRNFLFGVGLNYHVDYIDANYNFFSAFTSLASNILSDSFIRGTPIHNSFLIIGSELGIVGLMLYLRIFIREIRSSMIKLKKNSKYHKEDPLFVLGSLFVLIIYAGQGWALMKNFGWFLFILVISFSYLLNKSSSLKQR